MAFPGVVFPIFIPRLFRGFSRHLVEKPVEKEKGRFLALFVFSRTFPTFFPRLFPEELTANGLLNTLHLGGKIRIGLDQLVDLINGVQGRGMILIEHPGDVGGRNVHHSA